MPSLISNIFGLFNKEFFDNSLFEPSIKIDVTKKYSLRWESDEKSIVLGAIFPDLSKNEIILSMLHEMIHIYNFQNNLVDVNANQYHNMYFAKAALKCGLTVNKDKNQGWSNTGINPNIKSSSKEHRYDQNKNLILKNVVSKIHIEDEKLNTIKQQIQTAIANLRPSKIFFLKYECACPAPYNSIRSGRRPDGSNAPSIICDVCKTKFSCVSPLD